MLDSKLHSVDSAAFETHYSETLPIAIVGIGCRFGDARDPFRFWRKLCDSEEFARDVTAADLEAAGFDPDLLKRPDFVARTSDLKDPYHFDAAFFGYSAGEARQIDPQQRLFLTCAWEAMEMSGHHAGAPASHVGVFGAARLSTYAHGQREDIMHVSDPANFQKLIGNDKDYLASRTAYKLGLKGPAITVQTACSSSLVAIHMACEALRSGECDMALAGGAALSFPMGVGYVHRPGMIFSSDGKCRPFDAYADGTFMGQGVGVVALRPLSAALEAGEPVIAVIRGSAVNNDGTDKAGFTAPSMTGQRAVIEEAVGLSEIDVEHVGYVECHGTGTSLGDPIEVEALRLAYDRAPADACALGSVKANTGHLDTVAGVASLIKAAFVVRYGLIPPCLNFDTPNPGLNLDQTPFYVPKALTPWEQDQRLAAVSSFGIGGTNSHILLENLPDALRPRADTDESSPAVLRLSACDEAALQELAQIHAEFLLDTPPNEGLAAYCATVSTKRTGLPVTVVVNADDVDDLIDQLHDVTRFGSAAVSGENQAPPAPPINIQAFAPVAPLRGTALSAEQAPHAADSWARLTQSVQSTAEARALDYDWSSLTSEAEATVQFHSYFVGTALEQLEVFDDDTQMLTVAEIMDRGGIPARQTQLMQRLMRDLAEAGAVRRQGDTFGGLLLPSTSDITELTQQVRAQGYHRLADLAERAAPRLAEMLTGAVDPVAIVFPDGSSDDVEDMYERQRDSLYLNGIAADFVAKWAKVQAPQRKLRVLEIGAGTGGTTSALLPHLTGLDIDYAFTDIGGLFLRRAETKFADYPFLTFAPFNFETDAKAQGFEAGAFDLIVAANVIHNAADLKRSLGDIHRMLAPGGTLMMREIAERKPLFDMIFGPLAPQTRDNAWRNGELFPSLANWQEAAESGGFVDFAVAPQANSQADRLGEYIILAHASEAPPPAVSVSPDAAAATPGQALATFLQRPCAMPCVTFGVCLTANGANWIRQAGMWDQHQQPAVLDRDTAMRCANGWSDLAAHIPEIAAEGSPVEIDTVRQFSAPQTDGLWLQQTETGYVIFDDLGWPCADLKGVRHADKPRPALYEWNWQRVQSDSAPLTEYQVIAPYGQAVPAAQIPSDGTRIIDLCKADTTDLLALYAQITDLIAAEAETGGSIVFVTRGAVRATPWDTLPHAALAGLPALLRVAGREYSDLRIAHLDIDQSDQPEAFARALAAAQRFDQLALRQNAILAAKLIRSAPPERDTIGAGLYILSGGLSPLALETAHWLATQGASEIWVLARRQPSADEQARLDDLTQLGARVRVWGDMDLGSDIWPERIQNALREQHDPLRAVLHLAGTLKDAPIARLSQEDLQQALWAKVSGALHWADICTDYPDAKLILYSSAATIFGPPGQASHAIANGLLEGLAVQSATRGASVQALSWGYWDENRADRQTLENSFRSNGMEGLALSQGFDLLARALGTSTPVLAPMSVDWGKISARGTLPYALSEFVGTAPVRSGTGRKSTSIGAIRTEIAALLHLDPDEIPADENLIRLGFDSLMMLDLRQRLKDIFGIEIAADAAMEADTLAKLELYFAEHVSGPSGMGQVQDIQDTILRETADLMQCEVSELDPQENLVRLGLDSLMMLELGERLHTALGVRISAEMTLTHDTIASLSQAVAEMIGSNLDLVDVSEVRRTLRTEHPDLLLENGDLKPHRKGQPHGLSALQRHWLQGRDHGNGFGGTARHLYVEYDKPRASFDVEGFEAAWNHVVRRHDILRSIVTETTVTTLPNVENYAIQRRDLTDQDADMRDATLNDIRAEMSHQRFDLSHWPFFDLRVSYLDSETLRLHIDIDTTLVDVESFQIILREIGNHMVSGGAATLPDFQFSMADYRHGIELLNQSELMTRQQALAEVAEPHVTPNLPVETRTPAAQATLGIMRDVFPHAAWQVLRTQAENRGLTPTDVMLAVYAAVLDGWTGNQSGFSINLNYFDRKPLHIEMMNVVGDASATLPVRCDIPGDASLSHLAKTIRSDITDGLALDLIDGADMLAPPGTWGRGFALPVGFTSLMGVRKAYAVPETPDPTLGMPTYEYAIQPGQALHLQALEEESALMYNLDWVQGVVPDLMAEAIMLSIDSVLKRLSDGTQAWDIPLQELLPADPEIAEFLEQTPHRLPAILAESE